MTLKYVGRAPDSDYSVLDTKYVRDRYNTIKVDVPYINSEVANQSVNLVAPTYVDQQDALRAKKTNVDTADALYVPKTDIGINGGLVPLQADATIAGSMLGTVQTERPASFVDGTAIISGDRVTQSVTVKDYKAGTLSISDPGFPYYPLIIAQMRGGSTFGNAVNRGMGTGSFAQMSVLRGSDDLKFAWCLCTPHKTIGTHTAIPFADNTVTPSSRVCNGATTFDLWVGLFSGSTFTFNSTAFRFMAMIYPVFT
jgi:hypothetical protein